MSRAGKWAKAQVFFSLFISIPWWLMAKIWLIPSQIKKNENFLVNVPHVHHSVTRSCWHFCCLHYSSLFDCLGGSVPVLVLSNWWGCCLNLHLSDINLRHLRAITGLVGWLLAFSRNIIWHLFALVLVIYFPADCHAASHPFNWGAHIQSMLSDEMDWGGLTRYRPVCVLYTRFILYSTTCSLITFSVVWLCT